MYPRLSVFRLFLAWSVLAFHSNIFAIPFAGPIAVWCFFLISGFLVSNILYGCYAGRPGAFLQNRFLRIYPTYWAALAIGFMILAYDPIGYGEFVLDANIPLSYESLINNLFIFGILPNASQTIVPPAWSLAIELHWYLLLFAGSFLSKKIVIAFLLANLLIPFLIIFMWNGNIYGAGAGFAFALGALAYHINYQPHIIIQKAAAAIFPTALLITPIYFGASAFEINSLAANIHLIISSILVFLALPWLTEQSNTENKTSWLPNLAGDLSYPLFLVQFYGIWISIKFFDVTRMSWQLLFSTTIICLLISLAIVMLVERPIGHIRSAIRRGSKITGRSTAI